MNLILRLILVLVKGSFRKRLKPLDISSLRLHVLPNDLDIQLHMNNGRYLSLMDLGRIDLLVRTGFWRAARRHRWFPVVATAIIDYRRPLLLFQSYELRTKVLGWDDRWFYLEQQFVRGAAVAARATLKTMIRSAAGVVLPADALRAIGFYATSPELPEAIQMIARTDRSRELT